MTKSNVQNDAYVFQFNNGNGYLSWHEVNGRYTFGVTSMVTDAEMFEDIKDVPEWINNYLGGEIIHISLKVVE